MPGAPGGQMWMIAAGHAHRHERGRSASKPLQNADPVSKLEGRRKGGG
jgi:hypothetical protein